jgi:hypothetical protein
MSLYVTYAPMATSLRCDSGDGHEVALPVGMTAAWAITTPSTFSGSNPVTTGASGDNPHKHWRVTASCIEPDRSAQKR